tara:strand:+ start:916 stop:1284 length:369 start_codon:yes stop_codon:yes gene_type:complete
MREEIRKAISDVVYTADAKPRLTFTDGSPLEEKLALIDDAVNKVMKTINNPQRKLYCGWGVADAEHMFNQMKHDEDKFPDVEYTDELGQEIMDLVDRRFDASYGVTWDSIEYAIEEILREDK